jgi:hypothetical protein
METTFNKPAIQSLKADIKQSAALQRGMKNQRKTVHLKGERIFEPWRASMNVFLDGMKLRILYAAYGLMRGKKFSQIENHYPEENHPLNKHINAINKCIEFHTKKVEQEEVAKQFANKLINDSKDLDPEIVEIVNKNFKEILY